MTALAWSLPLLIGTGLVAYAVVLAHREWATYLSAGVVIYVFGWWAQTFFAADALPSWLSVTTTTLVAAGLLATLLTQPGRQEQT